MKHHRRFLSKIPPNNSKLTYVWEQYLFHYVSEGGITYLVMADDSAGRYVLMTYLISHNAYLELRISQPYAIRLPKRTATPIHVSPILFLRRRHTRIRPPRLLRTLNRLLNANIQYSSSNRRARTCERRTRTGERYHGAERGTDPQPRRAYRVVG